MRRRGNSRRTTARRTQGCSSSRPAHLVQIDRESCPAAAAPPGRAAHRPSCAPSGRSRGYRTAQTSAAGQTTTAGPPRRRAQHQAEQQRGGCVHQLDVGRRDGGARWAFMRNRPFRRWPRAGCRGWPRPTATYRAAGSRTGSYACRHRHQRVIGHAGRSIHFEQERLLVFGAQHHVDAAPATATQRQIGLHRLFLDQGLEIGGQPARTLVLHGVGEVLRSVVVALTRCTMRTSGSARCGRRYPESGQVSSSPTIRFSHSTALSMAATWRIASSVSARSCTL